MGAIGRYRTVSVLSDREEEVVIALISGHTSNDAIAVKLCIAKTTARSHVSKIIRKIGVENRTDIVLWALRNGFEAKE